MSEELRAAAERLIADYDENPERETWLWFADAKLLATHYLAKPATPAGTWAVVSDRHGSSLWCDGVLMCEGETKNIDRIAALLNECARLEESNQTLLKLEEHLNDKLDALRADVERLKGATDGEAAAT